MPEPERIPDNPTGDEFKKLQDDGRRFTVLKTVVGRHRRDEIVSARDLGPGAQVQWLLDKGAIAEAPRLDLTVAVAASVVPTEADRADPFALPKDAEVDKADDPADPKPARTVPPPADAPKPVKTDDADHPAASRGHKGK